MARRHRAARTPKLPFDDAFPNINTWERRVCYRTVTVEFTIHDVVRWLFPHDVLAALQAAFPLTSEGHPDCNVLIHFGEAAGPAVDLTVNLRIDCDVAQMCTPRDGLANAVKGADKHGIVDTMFECAHVVEDWNLVRDVVTWFNTNATPACARYYFPALGNFLDPDHPFHKGDGSRYAEPKESIGLVAHKVRRAAEIVAMATFCPPDTTKEATGMFLTILDRNDPNNYSKRSQPFVL